MSNLDEALQTATAAHGTGLLLTILEGLSRSHAVRTEHTKHGLFLKMLYPARDAQEVPSGLTPTKKTDETTASDIDTELEVHTSEPKQRLPDQVKPEDFLDKCTAIANEVADHLRALREEQKHSELEHTTIDKFGDLLAACPTLPRTSLDRDANKKKYDVVHHS